MFKIVLKISAAFLICTSGVLAQAQTSGLDVETRLELINKLTHVYKNLSDNDPSKEAITLRLADLWSEKGRFESAENVDDGFASRQKSMGYYYEALKSKFAPDYIKNKATILIQIGHMQQLNNQSAEAEKTYKSLTNDSDKNNQAEAYLALGEMAFRNKEFSLAKKYFLNVAALSTVNASRGMAAYRLAWCDFNLSQIQPGLDRLVQLLKTPEIITRNGDSPKAGVNTQFQEEVARDLATFTVKRGLHEADLSLVESLAPESARVAILTSMASEAERLSQWVAAEKAWKYVLTKQTQPLARLEIWVHLFQANFSLSKKPEAKESLAQALQMWQQASVCTSGVGSEADKTLCQEMRTRLKNTLVEWNKSEKTNPSEVLVQAYALYTPVFKTDFEVAVWGAQAAQKTKSWDLAKTLFEQGSVTTDASLREAALLGLIEVSETLKKDQMATYDKYVQMTLSKTKYDAVRYQRARLLYDQGQHDQAAVQFKALALDSTIKDEKLRLTSADLALDTLVLSHKENEIRELAAEFSKVFPQRASEFASIERKTVLNSMVGLMSAHQTQEAWVRLGQFNVTGAEGEDLKKYWMNRLVLADELKKSTEARQAIVELQKQKTLSADEKKFVFSRQAYYSELALEFGEALAAMSEFLKLNKDESLKAPSAIKMSMYASLSGQDPTPYYLSYLQTHPKDEEARPVVIELIRESKNPLKEIATHRKYFVGFENDLAALYVEIWEKTANPSVIEALRKDTALAQTELAVLLNKRDFIKEWQTFDQKIAAMAFDTKTQNRLTVSIKARGKILEQAEALAQKALETKIWSLQIFALSTVAREHQRFYIDLMSLPLPAGLSPEEEQEYMNLLSQQATPHQVKSTEVQTKLASFWQDTSAVSLTSKSWQLAGPQRKQMMRTEVDLLARLAPEDKKSEWQKVTVDIAAAAENKPSSQEIDMARSLVKENPFSASSLQSLIDVERKAGFKKRADYLQGRLNLLRSAK